MLGQLKSSLGGASADGILSGGLGEIVEPSLSGPTALLKEWSITRSRAIPLRAIWRYSCINRRSFSSSPCRSGKSRMPVKLLDQIAQPLMSVAKMPASVE